MHRSATSLAAQRLTALLALLSLLLALACVPPAAHAQAAAPPAPDPSGLDATPNPWQLADDLGARVDGRWNPSRGVYLNERGSPDTRLNSLLLQLHGMAALAGHVGPIRHDDRIEPMVRVLTAPPVLVLRNLRPREVGHIPHAPAWTALIGEDPEQARLHPSIDTAVVRALTAAWRARTVIGMDPAVADRIAQVLVELAQSSYYQGASRTLNQINWPTEVYAAALEVAGDTSVLADYREQLMWFAGHAHIDAAAGGSPNLTSGGGFRYLPNRPRGAQLNKVETIEYGNLALSSLGMYQAAVRAGMPPLPARELATLQAWSRHMLLGSWTHAGYPNWDTGLGTKRRHLRQYWAWSLDSLMTASGPDALLGYPKQRAYARSIAQHGIALYLADAWTSAMSQVGTPLPPKTSFGAPNGFSEGSGNELISPLRFAVLSASLDGRFQDVGAAPPPNWMAHDQETGRLAFSTPAYNGAILPTRAGQAQGGIEPVRLFDSAMHPLTTLGGRGTGSVGLSISTDGVTRLDTEPAVPTRQTTRDVELVGKPENTASSFGSSMEVTARASANAGRIALRHRLTADGVNTTYRLSKLAKGAQLALRVPVWNKDSKLEITGGAIRQGGAWVRTTAPLAMRGTTLEGGSFEVRFGGIPRNARITIESVSADGWRPYGARQLVVAFAGPKTGDAKLTRSILVLPNVLPTGTERGPHRLATSTG